MKNNGLSYVLYLVLLFNCKVYADCRIISIDEINFGNVSINDLQTNTKEVITSSNLKLSCNNYYKTFICLDIEGDNYLNNKLIKVILSFDNNFNYAFNNGLNNYYQTEVLAGSDHNLVIYGKSLIDKNANAGFYQGQILGGQIKLFAKEAANFNDKHPGCGSLLDNRVDVSDLIDVKANILAECKFKSMGQIDFGTVNNLAKQSVVLEGNLDLVCTNNTNFSLKIDGGNYLNGGLRRMQNQRKRYINYEIYQDVKRSLIWVINQEYQFNSSADNPKIIGFLPIQTNIEPGNYQDTLKVRLDF